MHDISARCAARRSVLSYAAVLRLCVGMLAFMLLWYQPACATPAQEYQLKVAFLYNAAKFVDWPPESMTATVFTIGVLGEDPFGPLLDALLTKTIKGKKIAIRRFSSLDKARDCQMVFISSSERRRLSAVISALRDVHVLTVSDIDGFARSGGMIEISMDQGRLAFDVNNRQTRKQGLKISSQLLKLAHEIVE